MWKPRTRKSGRAATIAVGREENENQKKRAEQRNEKQRERRGGHFGSWGIGEKTFPS